jgi:hypothetical protein
LALSTLRDREECLGNIGAAYEEEEKRNTASAKTLKSRGAPRPLVFIWYEKDGPYIPI